HPDPGCAQDVSGADHRVPHIQHPSPGGNLPALSHLAGSDRGIGRTGRRRLCSGSARAHRPDRRTGKMKTSIATVSISGDLREKLAAIAGAGFDGIEIFETDFLAFEAGPREAGRM